MDNLLIVNNRIYREEECKELVNDLEKKIKENENFWLCSNQKQRKFYTENLWLNKEYLWLRRYFSASTGDVTAYRHRPSDRFLMFLDILYKKTSSVLE